MLGKSAIWHRFSPCLPMLMSSMQMSRPGPGPACLLHKTSRKHVGVTLPVHEYPSCVVASDGLKRFERQFCCTLSAEFSC